MSPTSTPPGPPSEQDLSSEQEPEQTSAPLPPANPDGPVTFVPHTPEGAVSGQRVRIRTARYGTLEEHELVRLLDSIEDERARGRFRESVYISIFVWIAIAFVVLYGPKYIWHAPQIKLASDVLRDRELATISLPPTPHLAPVPPPKLDNNTLERMRAMTREHEAAKATPLPPRTPAPAAPPANLPNAPAPTANIPQPPPPVVTPQPSRLPPPAVAEAPTPQPQTKPSFNTGSGTAGQSIQDALNNVARNRSGGGGDFPSSPRGRNSPIGTGYEIVSDTQGVDFSAYIKRILNDIRNNWYPLLPEETRPPLMKQGEDQIRFKIGPDGTILAMVPEWSTHDEAINRSCWSAIVSENQFPPLPKEFHGPNLELRIHFLVNREPPQ
jgi:outer membrane biosynthesis protein TonB